MGGILHFEYPAQILTHDFPHVSYPNRERLAFLVGEELGVPHTTVFRAQEGYYSLHDFVDSLGTWTEVDIDAEKNQPRVELQSLQNIGILDILTENQDRNSSNILVVPVDDRFKLVPIDHALTLQKRDFHAFVSMGDEYQRPCWSRLKDANKPLTEESKNHIRRLASADGPLARVDSSELQADGEKIKLQRNAAFMAKMIDKNPNITLLELYKASLNQS